MENTIQPIAGFDHFETHHCVTGSLLDIYRFHGLDISEEMLLGLGEGVGYIYWHQKGQLPFVGGRAAPKPSLEVIAGRRTAVVVQEHTTSSSAKAERELLVMLRSGKPVMLQVDMGYLPYFDFQGEEYHFGGHMVVVCGYDPASKQVLIADRDLEVHPVALADLAKARASQHKPFPPKNRWLTFDFSNSRQPSAAEIAIAIHQQAERMVHPPIKNLGVAGIRTTARRLQEWDQLMNEKELRWTLFNNYIFISPVGGSGGGAFRYMFSRFLLEAAQSCQDKRLAASARDFAIIADRWEQLGEWCKQTAEAPALPEDFSVPSAMLEEIASLEGQAWERLYAWMPIPQAV